MTCITKGYVETSEGQVHYRATGRRHAAPILLLHQTASSSAMYEPLMERLADEYFLFAPDTPGFGGTFFPAQTTSIALYARILREAIDHFGLESCFVFGHHTGASIAVQMEFDQPFARRMILSGPPYLTEDQKQTMRAAVQPIVLTEDGSHLSKLWQRLRAKDSHADLSLTHREFVLNLHAGERYHEAYTAVFAHEFNQQLAAIDCPVLVMTGENDSLKDSLEPAFRALKHGELRRIAHANTYICDQQPDEVATILRAFF